MPVIMKDNVQYAYTTKGTVFHTLSNAEYEALPEEEKMNGDVYCIPDREPVINPDQLWEKVGTDTLDTTAQDLSGAVNELKSSLNKNNTMGNNNNITSYTESNPYVFPEDGYVTLRSNSSTSGYIRVVIRFANGNQNNDIFQYMNVTAAHQRTSLYVKKGMICYVYANTTNDGTVVYNELVV